MSRPFDPLFVEEEVQDAIKDYYNDMSSDEDDILSYFVVSENNHEEFISLVSDHIKFDLLVSHQYLNQFAFKEENAERYNTEFRASRNPDTDASQYNYFYTQQPENAPFQHLSWAGDLSRKTQISKSLIHAIYQVAIDSVQGALSAFLLGERGQAVRQKYDYLV